jgi:membrane associated rhomboid family serine protease
MSDFGYTDEHQPVTWYRGHPIYAAHMVVVGFVATMIATAVIMALKIAAPFAWLPFSSADVLAGQVWRVVTYGLLNPPSLWFAVDMLMIVMFGRELERFFGRVKFLALYGCIYVIPPLVFTAIGHWYPAQLVGETGAFALFIAFATLYPGAMMMFNIPAKWAALVLIGLFSLRALAYHAWDDAISIWANSLFAFVAIKYEKGELSLPRLRLPGSRPKFKVITGGGGEPELSPRGATMAEVDALLDKIAQSGISSLTKQERARLDSARERLARRDSGS